MLTHNLNIESSSADENAQRLLVLDDDEQIVSMIRRIAARAGCSVAATTDKEKFLEYLEKFSPTIVLVDVFLGQGDCTILLDELAAQQKRSPFRVLFMSGMGGSALVLIGNIARDRGVAVDRLIHRKRDLYKLEELLNERRKMDGAEA